MEESDEDLDSNLDILEETDEEEEEEAITDPEEEGDEGGGGGGARGDAFGASSSWKCDKTEG